MLMWTSLIFHQRIPRTCEYLGAFTTFKSSIFQDSDKNSTLFIPTNYLNDPYRKFSEQTDLGLGSTDTTQLSTKGRNIQPLLEGIPHLCSALRVISKAGTVSSTGTVATFTWEGRNGLTSVQEKPYLSEMGPLSTHALLCTFKSRYQSNFRPQTQQEASPFLVRLGSLTLERIASLRKDFTHDLFSAHLGIVSHRFYWRQELGESHLSGSFVWQGDPLDTVAFQVTHGALASYLETHLRAATAFRRLDWLSSRPLLPDSTAVCRGNVWSALMHAISEWLRVYFITLEDAYGRHAAVNGTEKDELLALTHLLKPFVANMLAVAYACGVLSETGVSGASQTTPVQSLSGLRLLAWLGRQAASTSTVSAVPFLFHRATAPFLRFLHLWVQEGVHEDPFNEFGICVNSRFLFRKDASFWRHSMSYQSVEEEEGHSGDFTILRGHLGQCGSLLGLVSADSEPGILRCGLSLLLLRSIAPNHFLFDSANAFPCLKFSCLNSADLRSLLQKHIALINEASIRAKQTWFKKLLQAEAEKREVLRKSHESDAMGKIEPEARELAVQEALIHRQRMIGRKPEAHLQSKRLEERDREFLSRLEEVESVKQASKLDFTATTFLEQLAEKEREQLTKMSMLKERIQLGESETSSYSHRTPLTPVNVEAPRQPVVTPVDLAKEAEEDAERGENFPDTCGDSSQIDDADMFSPAALESTHQTSTSFMPSEPSIVREGLNAAYHPLRVIRPHSQSVRNHRNKGFDGSLAKGIIYGKGVGAMARDGDWEKPGSRKHPSEEEIIAFSQELIESSQNKVSPWFDFVKEPSAPLRSTSISAYLQAVGLDFGQKVVQRKPPCSIPFFAALDRVINTPLLTRIKVVDRCLLDHFVMELKLLDHLRFVQNIFCHAHPVITPRILDALFSELSSPEEGRSIFNDTRKFQDLLPVDLLNIKVPSHGMQINTFSPFDISFQRVLFYFKQLQTVQSADSGGYVGRVFSNLALVYNAPWPVNICLHDRVLAKYNTVFCILARVKYALWALESVFHFLRDHRCDIPALAGVHFQASLWRHEMDRVVRDLDAYLCLHAVQFSWRVFIKRIGAFELPSLLDEHSQPPEELTTVRSLDELCQCHEECVDAIIHSCLVDNEKGSLSIQDSIVGLLESVHRFRRTLLLIQGQDYAASNQLHTTVDQFRAHSQSLHRLLKARVVGHQFGAKELSYLAHTLDYRHFYTD
uniref:Gamma tubulin complex component 6 n=2 Tax=Echinococcus granulosus TaxID=6210 RepID=A0A068WHE6_ECHGR|nr:gamma tubulin complex component 6 [Echinococcus granulosus]